MVVFLGVANGGGSSSSSDVESFKVQNICLTRTFNRPKGLASFTGMAAANASAQGFLLKIMMFDPNLVTQ